MAAMRQVKDRLTPLGQQSLRRASWRKEKPHGSAGLKSVSAKKGPHMAPLHCSFATAPRPADYGLLSMVAWVAYTRMHPAPLPNFHS